MVNNKHDVIIVGAGTAGMAVAYGLRNSDIDTLVLEKRIDSFNTEAPGKHARVTFMDYLQDPRFQDADLKRSILRRYSTIFFDTHGAKIHKEYPDKPFCVFNTDIFRANLEKKLTTNIEIRKGVFIRDARRTKGGVVLMDIEDNEYIGNIVVDCSGTGAALLNALGYRETPVYYQVIGFELENCHIPNPDAVRIFMDKKITDNGGGWVYPLSEDRCHFGMGIIVPYSKFAVDDLRARVHNLMRWGEYRTWFKKARIVPETELVKASPTLEPSKVMVADHLLIVGDSGGHAASYIGEGERPAGILGLEAAAVIKEAFADKNFSKEKLAAFVHEYQKQFGHYDLWSFTAREFFSKHFEDKDWTRTFKRMNDFSPEEFRLVLRSEYTRGLVWKMLGPKTFKKILAGEVTDRWESIYSVLEKIANAAELRP